MCGLVRFLLNVIEYSFTINNKNLLVYSNFMQVVIVVNISQIKIVRYFVVKLFSIFPEIKLKLYMLLHFTYSVPKYSNVNE